MCAIAAPPCFFHGEGGVAYFCALKPKFLLDDVRHSVYDGLRRNAVAHCNTHQREVIATTRPLIRQVNDHLAEAHRLAVQAGEPKLAESIERVWDKAAARAEAAEGESEQQAA